VSDPIKPRPVLVVLLVALSALAIGGWLGRCSAPEDPAAPHWPDVFDAVSPSVILVGVDGPDHRVGAGIAVSESEVLTARHLVVGATGVWVKDLSGRRVPADVVGTDARTDLALLWADAAWSPARLGSSRGVRVGDPVMAIGNPFGLGHSLSAGVVAHRGRRLAAGADGPRVDFLQLSIPLNPGNSGGPILDRWGEVVGVLSGTHTQGQAIAFAIPIEAATSGLDALRSGAHISRAFLGLDAVLDEGALRVEQVVPSGPADRAGIRPGDALTAVAGETLRSPEELTALLDRLPGGRDITLRLLRDGQLVLVELTLGDWAEQPVVVLGMTLRAAPGAGGEVVAVRPRSAAERAGVHVGDVVIRVNGLPVQAPVDVKAALGTGGAASVEVARDGVALGLELGPSG